MPACSLRINEEGTARLARDWNALPRPSLPRAGDPDAVIDPSTAADLDLLGAVSLEHLLNTPGTTVGRATLRRWILNPATVETVRARQEAVAELAPLVEQRQDVMLQGRLLGQSSGGYDQFVEWAEGEPWLSQRRGLVWMTRLLTLLTAGLLIAQIAGFPVFPALIAVVVINLVVSYTIGLRASADLDRIAARQNVFGAYAGIFDLIAHQQFNSAEMQRVQQILGQRRQHRRRATAAAGAADAAGRNPPFDVLLRRPGADPLVVSRVVASGEVAGTGGTGCPRLVGSPR